MSQTLFDLTGKIALVTGSSRGLGYTLAEGLGQAGATIILNGSNGDRLNQAVQTLTDAGLKVHGAAFDVTDSAQIKEQVARIEREIGSIDILVNNAGIQIRGPLLGISEEEWRRIMDVNLNGPYFTTMAVIHGMIERRAGKIINICSLTSEAARETIVPYTVSKGGLKMMTKGMATEWGKYNIQVNGLAPGYFATDMTQSLVDDEDFTSWLESRTPAARWGQPPELVGSMIYLASAASDFLNGQILYVDGGLLARM